MYWGANWVGGHDSAGAKDPSAEWHFAEGAASPGFETYYTLLNPNADWVWVQADYFLEDQDLRAQTGGSVVLGYAMAPFSRKTLLLNEELKWLRGGNVGGVSTRFATAGGAPIVAERSIYWGSPGRWPWVEGTNVVGAVAPGYAWWVPEGTLFPEYRQLRSGVEPQRGAHSHQYRGRSRRRQPVRGVALDWAVPSG